MTTPGCSSNCCETHDHSTTVARELNRRWWLGIVFIAAACALAYPAYTVTRWFWLPAALAAWFGTYQTIYSKGCSSCGAPRENGAAAPRLNAVQRATRRRMAHQFLAAMIVLAAISAWFLPLLWPLTAIVGWFAASFYVAVWTGYVGCPEVGAIPSWLARDPIATRCAPLERRDARAG
jgi:hypothetical protein